MSKILRFVLLSFLAVLTTGTYAQKKVTIDFDNDYQTIFPDLKGVSSQESNDGDFTGPTQSAEIGGLVVLVSPDADAATPSRIWTSSPRLRMYSGQFAVIAAGGELIKKIEFDASSKFDITEFVAEGEPTPIVDNAWTPATPSMGGVFTVNNNTQIKKIIVTLDAEDDTPEQPEPQVTEATCAEIIAGADGTNYRVTGKCTEIKNTTYGNWNLEDATGQIYIYGTLDAEGKTKNFLSLGIEEGDEITVEGPKKTYNGTVELVDVKVINIKKASQASGQVWDFTTWSDATIANLKADAAASKTIGWSDVEKKADAEAGADPTDISKDNCFWLQLEAAPADGVLKANGVEIEELKGLLFKDDATATSRNIAIAVNYPSTSLGTYAGGSYFWVGGKERKFTIPAVAAGSTITMEIESHKPTEGRGVKLVQGDTQIGDVFNPTTKEAHSWTIEAAGDVDVVNTNGCHIYTLKVEAGTASINTVKVAQQNGAIYNLAGQKVGKDYKGLVIKNGKKFIQK